MGDMVSGTIVPGDGTPYIGRMRLVHPATLSDFVRLASPFLLEHEAEHGLMLGVAAECVEPQPGAYWVLVVSGDDRPIGAALRTSDRLILSRMPADAAALVAHDALRPEIATQLRGVLGPPEAVSVFIVASGSSWRDGIAHRIYECREVVPPTDVPGECRLARREDRETIVRWMQAFAGEALNAAVSREAAATEADTRRVSGSLYVWEVDGEVVSTAAAVAPTPHGIRVSGVYTPPTERAHGYASALTAAVTQRQLDAGRALVFLYADLANPVSNRIYQRIGYRAVADVAMRWRADADAASARG